MSNAISTSNRLISLDALRGFTIAGMIIVNDPGSWSHVYPPLLHAEWNGITPTDLVYPFFLFIVGVSIVLAYTKRLRKDPNLDKKPLYKKIFIRSLKIFGVGIFLALFPEFDFANLRIAGVLQRIAIVFLVSGLLFLTTDWRLQARIAGVVLVLYWLLMMYMPVPLIGEAVMEPGRNWAAWLDQVLLPGTMWQGTWDPEGILSTFPAIVTGILGLLAGRIIISDIPEERKVIRLFVYGFGLFVGGIVVSWFFPINKNIWSSSFTLVTGGLAALGLATSYYVVDMLGHKRFTKIGIIFGANAITIYVLAGMFPALLGLEIFGGESLHSLFYGGMVNAGIAPKFASLVYALVFTAILFIPAWWLYKKKIFIKL